MQDKSKIREKSSNRELFFRKALHASGVLILAIQAKYGIVTAQLVIIIMLFLYSISEYLRLSGGRLPLFELITRSASSKAEQQDIVAAPIWFALGTLVSITAFPFKYAIVGVTTLTIGDATASLAGKIIQTKHPYSFNKSKTIEGTLAGFFTATLLSSLMSDPIVSVVGCFSGMITEALPIPIDDNITIPILSSFTSFIFGTYVL